MGLVTEAREARAEIVRNYKAATWFYVAPFICLLLSFINFGFFAIFLLTLFPASLAGLFLTRRGLSLAIRSGDLVKKDVGYANIILGVIIAVLGLVAIAFVVSLG